MQTKRQVNREKTKKKNKEKYRKRIEKKQMEKKTKVEEGKGCNDDAKKEKETLLKGFQGYFFFPLFH